LLEVSIPGFYLAKSKDKWLESYIVNMPGYPNGNEKDMPNLPKISELICSPEFSNIKIVIDERQKEVINNLNIQNYSPIDSGAPNNYLKECPKTYPEKLVTIETPHIWRDLRVSRINIFPIQYNKEMQQLIINYHFKVHIYYQQVSDDIYIRDKHSIKTHWDKLYKSTIINYPYENFVYNNYDKSYKNDDRSTFTTTYDYLIITSNTLANTAETLAKWKKQKGYKTLIETVSFPSDTTTIYNKIKQIYDNNSIDYVLLIGDTLDIPMKWTGSSSNFKRFSDFLYGELDACSPTPDFSQEIAIGRIPISDASLTETIINKIISYEKTPATGNWTENILLVANKINPYGDDTPPFVKCKQDVRDYSGYSITMNFEECFGNEIGISNSTIINYLNNTGSGILNYCGHGSDDCWDTWNLDAESFTVSDVSQLSNANETPIIFSVACHTADIAYTQCLAEAFFNKSSGGAVAFHGATCAIPSQIEYSNDMTLYYDRKIFKTLLENLIFNLGDVTNIATSNTAINTDGKRVAASFLWLGDPSLEVWTDEPTSLPSVSITENSTTMTVNTGISGCTIVLTDKTTGDIEYISKNTNSLTFNKSDLPLDFAITKHNYIPKTGEIILNMAFTSDYTIAENDVLIVCSNSNLSFSSGVDLIINGKLIMKGISGNLISCDRSGTSGTWGGIRFNPGSSGIIEYAEIKHADIGIDCQQAMPDIENCTITDNGTGVYIYYGSTTNDIIDNDISENTNDGIYIYHASPNIINNNIESNGRYGVYATFFSSPCLYENDIKNNTSAGLYTTWTSNTKLSSCSSYAKGHNVITGNGNKGVHAEFYSDPFLGYASTTGSNSIYNNSSSELYAYYYSDIQARYNYWGTSSTFTWSYYSSIDHAFELATDPNDILWSVGINGSGKAKSKTSSDLQSNSSFQNAYMNYLDGKYQEAISILESYLSSEGNQINIIKSIALLSDCYIKSKYSGFSTYLISNIKNRFKQKDSFTANLEFIHAGHLAAEGSYEEALQYLNELQNEYLLDEMLEKHSLFMKGLIYYKHLNNPTNAITVFNKLKREYPDDPLVTDSDILMGLQVSGNSDTGESDNDNEKNSDRSTNDDTLLPTSFELIGNYPNPFNPNTIIKFATPETGNVKITVYNILGEKITELINQVLEAGYHSVEFKAENLPSGIYIYSMNAEGYSDNKKMVLLK